LERASTFPRRTITSCLPVSVVPLVVSGEPDKIAVGVDLQGSIENLPTIHTNEWCGHQLPLARAKSSNIDLRCSHC
jgi:hypothetical protein